MDVTHECSVGAVALKKPLNRYPLGGAAYYGYKIMLYQQGRGREGAGIATCNLNNTEEVIRVHKGVGLVKEVFKPGTPFFDDRMHYLSAEKALVHVRYATAGERVRRELETQPFHHRAGIPWEEFVIGVNSNMTNADAYRQLLERDYGIRLNTHVDTEIMMHLLAIIKHELALPHARPSFSAVL